MRVVVLFFIPMRGLQARLWRAIDFEAGKVCYNELGDLYLDKLNKHHLTQNLERLGYTVTLEQRAA